MSEKEKPKLKWLEKLKRIKHIEVYIAIIFIVILLLIYLSNFAPKKKSSQIDTNELSVITYIDKLENNLEDILSNIDGVTDVKVLITLDMKSALVENSNINLSEFPEIKGVIVTAKGVNNTSTKLKVLHAIEAVIEIKNDNIQILSSD